MGVDVSKVVGYGLTGPSSGISVSKVVGYVLLVPGTESGATPPVQHAFTYAQKLRRSS